MDKIQENIPLMDDLEIKCMEWKQVAFHNLLLYSLAFPLGQWYIVFWESIYLHYEGRNVVTLLWIFAYKIMDTIICGTKEDFYTK